MLSRPALRVLAHAFVQAWQQSTRARQEFAVAALPVYLETAAAAWQDACSRATAFHEEMGRRREACDRFLRWVASGQISGFALTEPSAGSDTARVATRARLQAVPVETEPDGVLRFLPAGGKEPRFLLDARRLEYRTTPLNGHDALRACYRWSDTAEPALLRFDEYDYETDDPRRLRYYEHGGRRVHFTDIAQLRERAGRLWYDYWELTGAKMWITNGRMAGVLCLYAKTDEGVTGFIVDRHAEGLVVGKDEAKMGQNGSPTNELALQSVRVPRENVIGLEGRGQVNALETLNVGRAGLAMSAMAYMQGLVDASRDFARAEHGTVPDWAAWRLEHMEEEQFIAQSLAHEVIGRFEHPGTRSVRLESAVAKMLVTELYHHLIETAEEIHGPAGQTQVHLVEKRKRDERVLTIYEGTNEIQRFFILKDLIAEVAPRWPAKPRPATGYLGPEGLELEALKEAVRQRTRTALESLGQQLWQNPNLQANCFLLAEAVAWLAAAESTLGRLAWLSRRDMADENAEPSPAIALARRALARCQLQVRQRLKRFDDELTHLRRGYYAPEIRAAALLFRQAAITIPPRLPASRITRSLSVLVVIDTLSPGVPHPHLERGRLEEPYRVLSEADRAALETALRLRDTARLASGGRQPPDYSSNQGPDGPRSPAAVAVEVVAVGPPSAAQVLREALALGVDRVRLIVREGDTVSCASAAAALAAVVGNERSFDVILGGGGGGQEGVLVQLQRSGPWACHSQAPPLTWPFSCRARRTSLRPADRGRWPARWRTRSLPTAAAIEAGQSLRPFTVSGFPGRPGEGSRADSLARGCSRTAGTPGARTSWRHGHEARGCPACAVLGPGRAVRVANRRARDEPAQRTGHRGGCTGGQRGRPGHCGGRTADLCTLRQRYTAGRCGRPGDGRGRPPACQRRRHHGCRATGWALPWRGARGGRSADGERRCARGAPGGPGGCPHVCAGDRDDRSGGSRPGVRRDPQPAADRIANRHVVCSPGRRALGGRRRRPPGDDAACRRRGLARTASCACQRDARGNRVRPREAASAAGAASRT